MSMKQLKFLLHDYGDSNVHLCMCVKEKVQPHFNCLIHHYICVIYIVRLKMHMSECVISCLNISTVHIDNTHTRTVQRYVGCRLSVGASAASQGFQ